MAIKPRRKLCSPSGKAIALPAIHPNVGITVGYREKLDRLIAQMQRSICYWLTAQYRASPPLLAEDASPASELLASMRSLGRRWLKRFDEGAKRLGEYFATTVSKRSDATLKRILKDAGFMRSVQQGRDLATLTTELETRYGITRRRAALIARDQNNKATAAMTRVRYQELGLTQAIWMHSAGGKEPRPTHVANSGKAYNVSEGWLDPAVNERIWPGTLINCRCVARPILPVR